MNKWYENEISKEILKKKYLHDNEDFEGFLNRVSSIFDESIREKIKQAIKNGDFFPAGRILYGAGSEDDGFKTTPFNCYVLPNPEDDLADIYKSNSQMAKIFSRGGGCGVNISNLRPKGAIVQNSAKTSTGAVSFMHIYNTTGEIIGQNNRRAAIMIGLNCNHPDVEEFLHIKENNNKLSSMNISILFTDDFFEAVKENKMWTLKFDIKETGEHIERQINAREFFKRFCKVNYDYGEPGIIFIDTVRRNNLLSGYDDYHINISNPCSEFLGADYTACCLGSINLYNCVDNKFTLNATVNWTKLTQLTALSVVALNNVLDYGLIKQPLKENMQAILDWRNIGLGFFGLADMLVALGIRYGSKEAIELSSEIAHVMFFTALTASMTIARNNKPFGKYDWEKTKQANLINSLQFTDEEWYQKIRKYGLANGSLISIAPTGSLSLLAGGLCGGIEPFFKVSYERTTHKLESDSENAHTTKQIFRVFPTSIKELLEHHHLPLDLTNEEIKKEFPFVVEATDIPYQERIKMQSAVQRNIDNAISSTINLPKEATVEDIFNIYMMAHEYGLKGVTVFRENCKRLSILNPKQDTNETTNKWGTIKPVKRSDKMLPSVTYQCKTACSKLYVTISFLHGRPFEVFTAITGGCVANISNITRLTSLALRSGIDVNTVIKDLSKQNCPACQTLRKQGKNIELSCGIAIANALKDAIKHKPTDEAPVNIKEELSNSDDKYIKIKCPECGGEIHTEGKCIACNNCGWSKCE